MKPSLEQYAATLSKQAREFASAESPKDRIGRALATAEVAPDYQSDSLHLKVTVSVPLMGRREIDDSLATPGLASSALHAQVVETLRAVYPKEVDA